MLTTAQAQAGNRRLPAARERLRVIEFQPRARFAAMALVADKRAPAAVALPDYATNLGRHVARVLGSRPATGPRAIGAREAPLLELGDQRIQRSIEHLREIAGRHGVPQQLLRIAQLVVRGLCDRDLQRDSAR